MATTVRVTCCICGDTRVDAADLRLVAQRSGVDYSFTHCDTETRRHATNEVVEALVAVGVRVVHADFRPVHCTTCGVRRFEIGDSGVYACRNCDSPAPGLPPADRSCGR